MALLVKEVGIGQIINPAYYIKILKLSLVCPLTLGGKCVLLNPPKPIGKEFRFATYVNPPDSQSADLTVVKEIIHYDDGTTRPHLNLIENNKRPFWVTAKGMRNHQQKKEWALEEELIRYETRQCDLQFQAAIALGMRHLANADNGMRTLKKSPYLYGVDISPTAILKHNYLKKYGVTTPQTMLSLGVIDIETGMLEDNKGIIMLTFTMGSVCVTAVRADVVKNIPLLDVLVDKCMNKYLSKYVEERNIKPELYIADTEIDLLKIVFGRIHEEKPDVLAVWNLDFEISRFEEAAARAGVDLKDIVCDPSIKPEYRFFKYKRGKKQKETSSGKIMPIKPAAQWHTVTAPASFYFLDGMCAYKHTRAGVQEEQSYGLDAILAKHKLPSKLDIPEAAHLQKARWHIFMQQHHMVEYIVYNRFDCITVELLQEEIKDLTAVVPLLCENSDFEDMKSQPKRLVDALHWEVQESGYIIGCTADSIVDEFDGDTTSRDGWVVTLPAPLISKAGLRIIEENDRLDTSVYAFVGDQL